MTGIDNGDQLLREMAIKRLRNKRGLQAHLLAYATVNLFLVALFTSPRTAGFSGRCSRSSAGVSA
jgi:hypothetical protein